MKQRTLKAAVGLLVPASAVGLILLLAGQLSQSTLQAPPTVPTLPYPTLIVLLVALGGALAFAFVRLVVAVFREPVGTRTENPGAREALTLFAVGILTFFVIYFAMAFVMSLLEVPEEEPSSLLSQGEEGEQEELPEERLPFEELIEPGAGVDAQERSPLATLLIAGLAIATAAVVAAEVYRRYSSRPEAEESEALDRLSADLQSATSTGLERMLEEPDHRRAVIAAYALVERTFERHGYPRESSDTPLEFMAATLAALERAAGRTTGGPARRGAPTTFPREALLRLTELYEVAKFSEHPVGSDDRRRAVESMRRIGAAFGTVGTIDGAAEGAGGRGGAEQSR